MSVARMHGLYAVKVGASTLLGGITRRSARLGNDVRQIATSGDVYARFQALYAVKPMCDFASLNLAAALDLCGLTGFRITSGATLLFYCQQQQKGGSRMSGSNHRIITVNEGLLLPRRITCEHQGDAQIDYDVLPIYDGSNDPIVVADTSALGTNPGDAERFTLGPVTLAWSGSSMTLPEIRRTEIDFGVQAETVGADSDLYDTNVRIVEIQPSITFTGIDIEWFKSANIPIGGRSLVHSGGGSGGTTPTTIVFRKRALGGTFVAAATAEHIGMTACGMAVVEQLFDAQGNALDECSLRIPLRFDGTNAPITIDTTYAYA